MGDTGRQITASELERGDDIEDILGYMEAVSEVAAAEKIQELKDLTRRQPVDRKRGRSRGGSKLLAYGGQQMPETQIKIEEIRQ